MLRRTVTRLWLRGTIKAFAALNRIIDDWDKYLGDAAQATTILDRLMHRSVLVEFRGKSFRLEEAANRLVKGHDSE